MDGIIIVNKPKDWTSFDVVAKIRNLSRVKKVGHSGTLDPMATGVLPVFLGRATKDIQRFLDGDKGYVAEMTLGITTDSGDAYGKILNSKSETLNNFQIQISNLENIIKRFTGEIQQLPPMYSAIKINGQRLYKLARKGITVEREPRTITIHSLKMLKYEPGEHPKVTIEVICSKGTYIRQLAVDIGAVLGCGAHLSQLERTYAHPFRISQALSMEAIISLAKIGKLDTIVIPVEEILTPSAYGGHPSPFHGEGMYSA
jgi:tRNA pseudouridine55 synthase